jgi:hypothetical protein
MGYKENEGTGYLVKLKDTAETISKIQEKIGEMEDIPSWIQDKITIAQHNMVAILEWVEEAELSEEELEEAYSILEAHGEKHGICESENIIGEAEYQGREVELGKIMRGDVKKFKVYVKNDKGNVVKVNFGQKGVKIKKNNPERRKSFRARHNCDNPGPRHKARYWACRTW